jgi:serine O-acetyltransferase
VPFQSSRINAVRGLFCSPLVLVYLVAEDRPTILVDVARWIAIKQGRALDSNRLGPTGSVIDMLALCRQLPEFRTLLYYRAKGTMLGRVVAGLMSRVFRGASGLVLSAGSIGPGLYIEHGTGSIVNADSIARDCWINQNVTISAGSCLEERSQVRVGAVVLNGARVGANAVVGANSVVRHDVPPGHMAGGVPATSRPWRRLETEAAWHELRTDLGIEWSSE